MTDATTSDGALNLISQATELLAAHGVYALTAIFIFYQQRRAYVALNRASTLSRSPSPLRFLRLDARPICNGLPRRHAPPIRSLPTAA